MLNLKPPRHSYSTLFCHTRTAAQGQLTVGHALLAKPSRNSRFLREAVHCAVLGPLKSRMI